MREIDEKTIQAYANGEIELAEIFDVSEADMEVLKIGARTLLQAGELESALVLLRVLEGWNRRDMGVALLAADLRLKLGHADAEGRLVGLVDSHPDNRMAQVLLAEARLQSGDPSGAFMQLTAVLARDPSGESPAGARARAVLSWVQSN